MDKIISFPDKKYAVIYADPPWQHQRALKNPNRRGFHHPSDHYPVMDTERICELPVSSIASKNSLLFLWTTSCHLVEAIKVGEAWGFKYSTIAFIWHKQRKLVGNYTLSECEICLVFKKGKIPKPRGKRNIRQFLSQKRGRHSEKPNEIRDRITEMFPTQAKIELFARQRVQGWDAWGNEV